MHIIEGDLAPPSMVTQVMKKDTLFPNGDWIIEFQKNSDAKEFERRMSLSSASVKISGNGTSASSLAASSSTSSSSSINSSSINSSSSNNSNNNNSSNNFSNSNNSISSGSVTTSSNPLRVKFIDPNNFDSWYTTKKLKLDNKTILFGNLSEKITQNELSYIFDGFHLAEDPFRRISRNFFVNNNPCQAYFIKFHTSKEARRAVAEKVLQIEGVKPCVHWYNI